MTPGLVIFDCDGVLVDSEPIANRIFAEELERAGFPIELREVCRRFIGRSMGSCYREIESQFGKALPADFDRVLKRRLFAALPRELQPFPGVERAIEAFAPRVCVASSGEPEKIELSLRVTGLLDHFGGRLFSASQVARGKPDPDLFLFAAREMGVPPERCVVVEDSLPGVRAGLAAGMRVFGFCGSQTRSALEQEGALPFSDFAGLASLVSRAGRP